LKRIYRWKIVFLTKIKKPMSTFFKRTMNHLDGRKKIGISFPKMVNSKKRPFTLPKVNVMIVTMVIQSVSPF